MDDCPAKGATQGSMFAECSASTHVSLKQNISPSRCEKSRDDERHASHPRTFATGPAATPHGVTGFKFYKQPPHWPQSLYIFFITLGPQVCICYPGPKMCKTYLNSALWSFRVWIQGILLFILFPESILLSS